jgi:DNA-binding MarR family transcriptional regulator
MTETALALLHLLGPWRRAMVRATRDAEGLPDISDAQVELLRVLIASGPLNTRDAATRLRMARPTVSNLVKTMTAAGLIDRTLSESDLRSAALSASPAARDILARFDAASSMNVAAAIGRLPARDRATLVAAVPVLTRLALLLGNATEPATPTSHEQAVSHAAARAHR